MFPKEGINLNLGMSCPRDAQALDGCILPLMLLQVLASPHPKLWATKFVEVARRGGQEIGSGFRVVFRFATLVRARVIPKKNFCARSF